MADSRFSSKRGTGSLARRILLITLCLLVFPLFIYIIVDLQDNYRSRLRDLLLSLDTVGKGQGRLLSEFIQSQKRNLNTFTFFLDLNDPLANEASQFQEITQREELSSLFLLSKEGLSNKCTISSNPALVGLTDLFQVELKRYTAATGGAFLGINPASLRAEVFVVQAQDASFLISSFDAEKIIAKLKNMENVPYPFQTTLLSENGELLLSSDPEFSLSKVHLLLAPQDIEAEDAQFYYFAKIEEKASLLNLFRVSDSKIGLKLPIEDSSFALLVDLPEQSAFDISRYELFYRYLVLFLLLLVVGGGLTWILMKRMARPLMALQINMKRAGEGQLSSRYTKDILGFEINLLGAQFNAMVEGILHHMEEIEKIKVGRELLMRELKIGQEIQNSIFPKELPAIEGLEIAPGFQSAHQVTGDFYDLFLDAKDNLILTLGDAAGKGIPACLFALILRSMLRSAFYTMHAPLEEIVSSANRLFCQDTQESGYFATAWFGKLDLKTRQLHFSSCGHLPGLLVRKGGKIEELMTPGTALGVQENIDVTVSSVTINRGDLLLLYSDGILEAHDKEQNLFGKVRLRDVISDGHQLSAAQLVAHIFSKIEAFSTGAPQHDDLMLLALRFH